MDETIYVKGLINQLEPLIKGRSLTFPEGWIEISDLEQVIQKYKNKELDRLGVSN